jgi:Glycosyl transferase family 2
MKVALVCIAKNEDNYIEEWIKYHKKLGFDDIFIYQNNWRMPNIDMETINIESDGNIRQLPSYNHFIENNWMKYQWAAFWDIDEFLVLKKHKNIKEFISDYDEYSGIGINCYLFGDNGKTEKEFGLINRFTKRQLSVDRHVKCIYKMQPSLRMTNPHHGNVGWTDTNKNTHYHAYNPNGPTDIAQINHYFCKTVVEFQEKISRGFADCDATRDIKDFHDNNHNDIEDLQALKFYKRK